MVSCKLIVQLQYQRGALCKDIELSGSMFHMHTYLLFVLTTRSTTGYVVFAVGGPLAWHSKLQTTVSASSMDEYQAMYAGMQELVWLRGVMVELGQSIFPRQSE